MIRLPSRSLYLFVLLTVCWGVVFNHSASGQSTKESPADDRPTLRILCYNIHHGEGIDRKLDLERIAKTILSVKPDIVALQEVDVETTRTRKVHQAKRLGELTNMNYVFGGNIQFGGGEYGNAVLSRFPIKKSKNLKLPNHRKGEQRGLFQVEVQPDFMTDPLHFWCTHLDHRGNDSERVASAKLINEELSRLKHKYCILAGDLNDVLGSDTLELLDEKWNRSNSIPLPTIPVQRPSRQIDFICSSQNRQRFNASNHLYCRKK